MGNYAFRNTRASSVRKKAKEYANQADMLDNSVFGSFDPRNQDGKARTIVRKKAKEYANQADMLDNPVFGSFDPRNQKR